MKKLLMFLAVALLLMACDTKKTNETMSSIKEKTIQTTIESILSKTPEVDTAMLKKGVQNVANFWKSTDGSQEAFQAFCESQFMTTPEAKQRLFETIQKNLETIYGNYNRISLGLKEAVQLVGEDYTAIDEYFGALDPYAHFADDMFGSKIAFSVLLNFPFYSLREKNDLGIGWSRQEWAYARMGDLFTSRIPAEMSQKISTELATTENYISNYNIKMEILRNEEGRQVFTDSMTLIAHWGLRDELKADYADKKDGLEKQQLIYEVMKHIIYQSIPEQVINNGNLAWKPISNKIYAEEIETAFTPEPNTRYKRLFASYEAMKAIDPYCLSYQTALIRAFDRDMEVSAENIESIFTSLIGSPEVGKVAELIKFSLGRDLKPFDIWYDGFKDRSSIPENELTKKTRALYPTTQAFEKGMPAILTKLGFSQADANDISARVTVDNSRGSGHAWGAQMRSDKAHLRTRIQPGGMDYKGYNIALHEFGHNVEQTITLNRVDNYIISGVPSTAFTETLAFVFQKRDLDVLGYKNDSPEKMALQTLDIFWGCYEIMGVSLVELRTWKWLYEHPEATAEDLKTIILQNAKDLWNQYYEPFLGEKDSPILAVYSHMIEYPLYLSNYPYGHIVEFQLEKHFGENLPGEEIQRIYPVGRLTPDHWMQHAVGESVSVEPMLEATAAAVALLK
jgi:hypothetical protein